MSAKTWEKLLLFGRGNWDSKVGGRDVNLPETAHNKP